MRHERRWLYGFLALIVAAALVASACAPAAAPPTPTPAPKAAPTPAAPAPATPTAAPAAKPTPVAKAEPYKIGVVYSLTGPLGVQSQSEWNGAKLLLELTNAKGGVDGRQVEYVLYDGESKPDVVTSRIKKLVQEDKVLVIVGDASYSTMGAALPLINELKTPNVNTQGIEMGSKEKTPYWFTAAPTDEITERIFPWLKKKGITKIGQLVQADAYGDHGVKVNPPLAAKHGVEIVASERFLLTDKDLTPQLTKLKAQGVESVLAFTSGAAFALAAKNFKQLGMKGYVVSHQGSVGTAIKDLMGDAADVAVFSAVRPIVWKDLPDTDPAKGIGRDLMDAYKAKYGVEFDAAASEGYDAMVRVLDGLKAGPDKEKIRERLENQKGLVTMAGTVNASPANHQGLGKWDEYILIALDPKTREWKMVEWRP